MVARAAFSLVEVIVAMTLLSLGLLTVAGSGILASRLLSETELREEIVNRVSSVLDSIVANEVVGAGTLAQSHYTIVWQAADEIEVSAMRADTTVFKLRSAR